MGARRDVAASWSAGFDAVIVVELETRNEATAAPRMVVDGPPLVGPEFGAVEASLGGDV
jgi:hypothetical protein